MAVFTIILDVLVYLGVAFCFFNVLSGLIKGSVLGPGLRRISKYTNPKEAKQFNYHFYKYLIVGIFVLVVWLIIKK